MYCNRKFLDYTVVLPSGLLSSSPAHVCTRAPAVFCFFFLFAKFWSGSGSGSGFGFGSVRLGPKQTRFVPKDPSRVLWYMCGPTVYDASHMGHGEQMGREKEGMKTQGFLSHDRYYK